MIMAAALLLATPAMARDDHAYGPPPDWTRYKELAEAAVRARLPPSNKWSVEWPNGYARAAWHHHGHFPGYVTCGILRAGEPTKGFNPVTRFAVVVDHDRVGTVDISGREGNSFVNIICQLAVDNGTLPPSRAMDAPRDLPIASIGLTIRPMPEGAYVLDVTPGSPAANAGLSNGAVLTRANGIALAGLGPAMAAVLGGDVAALVIDTAAGGRVEVKRAAR